MNRTFWAGFGMAVIVILLPVLFLIDARSSVDSRTPEKSPAKPSPPLPDQAEPPASLPPLPEAKVPVSSSSLAPPPPLTPLASLSPREMEHPEIVFSPERIRRSLAKDPRLGKSLRRTAPKPSGIRTIIYDPTHVTTVKTAVSHVTLIDLPEEAKEVYLGDAKLFLAEVFGPRVKVKPITWDPKETTNMIVYTLHRQFAFRLRVVPEGEEDDLLTFYLPRSDTVVNLTPLRKKMERDLAVREQGDLRKAALKTLRRAGASEPVGVFAEKNGLRAVFLGFSSLGKERYALFEVRNKSRQAVRLSGIRLRLFKSSLFWEGHREWVEGEDYSRGYHLEILPKSRRRVLLPADPPPLSSSREGYLVELWIEGDSGGRQIFRLEARGHQR